MTKHTNNISPSIMEPVDETPSLTLAADIIDAMKSDHYPNDQPILSPTETISTDLHTPSTKAIISMNGDDINANDVLIPATIDIALNVTERTHNMSSDMKSINMHYEKSFLFIDGKEEIHVLTPDLFCKRLGCAATTKLKVVSIFGNTGDGKSHTMNNVFFGGEEIFRTSDTQDPSTLGVWAAYQKEMGLVCLDTEGLLGKTLIESQRMRMLLKVLAISDIIIYRTRSERLHKDMYTFLGTASKAYHDHFASALQSLGLPGPPQNLGPAVFIFHETIHTKPLESSHDKSAEDYLREEFATLHIDLESFSSLKYIGIQTTRQPTNFNAIQRSVYSEIKNTTVRSPRPPTLIYQTIDALNLKFSGKIIEIPVNPFPEQYFTCGIHCQSCNERCEQSMGHAMEGKAHSSGKPCRYQHQYENRVYLCRQCHQNGREVIVKITTHSPSETSWYGLAKFAWSGSVIECPNCGEIFRSRQYWYGNKMPEDGAVRTDIVHVWQNSNKLDDGPTYSGQMVVDGVTYISETVCNIGAQPSKKLTKWLADQIAPSYWKSNATIIVCHLCRINFEKTQLKIHHCRGCGEGFCGPCSKDRRIIPARGWTYPVRVCDTCKDILIKNPMANPEGLIQSTINNSSAGKNSKGDDESSSGDGYQDGSSASTAIANEEQDVMVRKYGEVFINTISSVVSVLDYPKEIIKDKARPSYWVPDIEAPNCAVCERKFGTAEELAAASTSRGSGQVFGDLLRHHCRDCGMAVCDNCSLHRRPVPERGWTTDVRVCNACKRKAKCD